MVKTTVKMAHQAYKVLDTASYSKLGTDDRKALIGAMRALRKAHDGLEEFRSEAVKRLRPDGFDRHEDTLRRIFSLSGEEQSLALSDPANAEALAMNLRYSRSVEECVEEEGGRVVELDFAPMGAECFDRLMDGNPEWTAGRALELNMALTGEG